MNVSKRFVGKTLISKYALVGIILVIGIVFSLMNPIFITGSNLLNIVRQASAMIIYATGMTFIMLAGMIDISVIGVALFASMIAGLMMQEGVPVVLAVLAGFASGALFGLINGLLVTHYRLEPMIVTLATNSIAAGATLLLNDGAAVYKLPDSFMTLGRGYIGFLPLQVIIMLLVVTISAIVLSKTVFGRRVYAIGGNQTVAKLSGINVNIYKVIYFVLCSLLAVLAGMIATARVASAQATPSSTMLMNVIAAVVIGGTSMSGGRGNVIGSVLGSLLLSMINSGLTINGVSAYWQTVISAGILVVTIILYKND